MAQDESDGPGKAKPEPAVLSDSSLINLSRQVSDCIVLSMYLNVPTTTIVLMKCKAEEEMNGLSAPADEDFQQLFSQRLILYWKKMRATAKDKDKVLELEKSLREAGKHEIADVFNGRHKENLELTYDCFT